VVRISFPQPIRTIFPTSTKCPIYNAYELVTFGVRRSSPRRARGFTIMQLQDHPTQVREANLADEIAPVISFPVVCVYRASCQAPVVMIKSCDDHVRASARALIA
jgi:hypothetical protein